MTAGECLPELLRRPFCRWVSGDVVMENSSATQFHEDEYVQCAECGGDHHEEVAGDEYCGMIADEGQPTLLRIRRTDRSASTQVLSDSTGRYSHAEFQFEFVGNALLSPGYIRGCHPADELPQFFRHTWSSGRSGLPA